MGRCEGDIESNGECEDEPKGVGGEPNEGDGLRKGNDHGVSEDLVSQKT